MSWQQTLRLTASQGRGFRDGISPQDTLYVHATALMVDEMSMMLGAGDGDVVCPGHPACFKLYLAVFKYTVQTSNMEAHNLVHFSCTITQLHAE